MVELIFILHISTTLQKFYLGPHRICRKIHTCRGRFCRNSHLFPTAKYTCIFALSIRHHPHFFSLQLLVTEDGTVLPVLRPRATSGNHLNQLTDCQINMTPENAFKPSEALTARLHPVHLVSRAPFSSQESNLHGHFNDSTCAGDKTGRKQLLIVQKIWHERPELFKPIHGCHYGDRNLTETAFNVLTSLPFIALGLQAPRKNLNCKIYANSLIGVGLASSFYHASRGKVRKYLRWADHTMIATAAICLSRAIRAENPKLLMAASALFLPVQPLMVSAIHTGMMEISFAKRAFEDPDLRIAHNVHKMSTLLGGALFMAEDLLPQTPFLHAGWHIAAAVGVGTCNKLLD